MQRLALHRIGNARVGTRPSATVNEVPEDVVQLWVGCSADVINDAPESQARMRLHLVRTSPHTERAQLSPFHVRIVSIFRLAHAHGTLRRGREIAVVLVFRVGAPDQIPDLSTQRVQ